MTCWCGCVRAKFQENQENRGVRSQPVNHWTCVCTPSLLACLHTSCRGDIHGQPAWQVRQHWRERRVSAVSRQPTPNSNPTQQPLAEKHRAKASSTPYTDNGSLQAATVLVVQKSTQAATPCVAQSNVHTRLCTGTALYVNRITRLLAPMSPGSHHN